MRIMVTGARGMLGTDLCSVFEQNHQVLAIDVDDFDIVDQESTTRWVLDLNPDLIVHLAAYTDVDGSEEDPQRAFAVNALGTMNVARSARMLGAGLVYLSTDYVFDGRKRQPYLESDEPNPINIYGLSKLYGELYVSGLTLHHLIIRTSWLFGPNGRNFVDTIIGKAERGEHLRVVNDQRGCPTYTLDLAKGIKQVIERGLEGVVHITNSGETTWYELACYALKLAGVDARPEPVSSDAYPAKARRPTYSVLGSPIMTACGIPQLPGWQDGVRHHLSRLRRIKGGESK